MRSATILLMLLLAVPVAGQNQAPSPCGDPEFGQFDFWVGTWVVHANDRVAGHNTIRKVSGGCSLLESYEAAQSPYEGVSLNWYDKEEKQWHQLWTDNAGTILDLAGEFRDGSMVLEGERMVGNTLTAERITWTPADDGSVRQHWEQSTDGGRNWVTAFDGHYVKAE